MNFLTTVVTMRAPGMTMGRLPLVIWQQASSAILFLLSVGPLIAGAVMLLMDRVVGTGFFLPPRLAMPFGITTILISVPFALIVFAMIASLYRGSISFELPMLWALRFSPCREASGRGWCAGV